MTRQARQIRVLFEKGSSREETLLGRDYLVVPVVAMVEGVRFGAGQTQAELGLVSEFGDTPITWANKPLVLNHPQVDGVFVSANSPDILEAYQFGVTMNPYIDDSKLKMEAWIDIARVNSLEGNFKETYDRIVAQEDVEVSVGFFSDIEEKKGKFKGQTYGAIWRNIKPDHLAVLTEGTIGACSVEDGCGIPRVNKDGNMTQQIQKPNQTTETPVTQSSTPKGQCSCGGAHTQEEHVDDDEPVTQKGLKSMLADLLKPFTQSKEEKAQELHINNGGRKANEILVGQSIDPSLMDRDVRSAISRALSKAYGNYVYLLGYTQDVAVYENYNPGSGSYLCYQIGIEVAGTDCKFVGEPAEVILQTKIVPQAEDTTTTTTPAKDETTTVTQSKENDMADDKTKTGEGATTQTQTTPAPNTQEKKPLTVQEYLKDLPQELQETIGSALKAQETRKEGLLKVLKESDKNKFTEEFLKAQSVEFLENLVAMLPGTYAGVSAPTSVTTQSKGDNSETVPVVKAFAKKTDKAAA